MRGILRYGQRGGALDHAHFIDRFEYETELTGYMTLSLRVSTSEGDNLDHFVLLRKFDAEGRRTSFFTDITALPVMGLPGADYVSPTTRLPLHMERGESARSCWRK
jgi:hypothetical protein